MASRSSSLSRLLWRWRLERILRQRSNALYRKLELPDGLDGLTRLGYLLLTDAGLVLVELRLYPGVVFAAQEVDQWTQMIGGRSFQFANPVRDLEHKLAAIRLHIDGAIPLRGFLLFSRETEFPKGRPECVVRLEELAELLPKAGRAPIPAELDRAWRSLASARARAGAAASGRRAGPTD